MDLTDLTFDAALAEPGLLLVDFWAPWCGPCKVLGPTLDRLAVAYPAVRVYKVDVDANPDLQARFAVRSIPFVMFFKDGVRVDTSAGAVPYGTLEAKVRAHTGSL